MDRNPFGEEVRCIPRVVFVMMSHERLLNAVVTNDLLQLGPDRVDPGVDQRIAEDITVRDQHRAATTITASRTYDRKRSPLFHFEERLVWKRQSLPDLIEIMVEWLDHRRHWTFASGLVRLGLFESCVSGAQFQAPLRYSLQVQIGCHFFSIVDDEGIPVDHALTDKILEGLRLSGVWN
jgi:hypothetical protein